MTPDVLWNRYAATWSLANEQREGELAACLADDVTYCDPNHSAAGRAALSDYMEQFQRSVPGGRFRILSVLYHHDRSLAEWTLHSADAQLLQRGTSFGLFAADGRLLNITGFFCPKNQSSPA
jgi:hypothetical protein